MRFYEATSLIRAQRDRIWGDPDRRLRYATWDSGVVRVEGRIAPGEKIKVVSEANPKRAFPVKVTGFELGRSMIWSGGMPLGLFRGVRTFTLTPEGEATHFTVREEYSGPLLGMNWKSMPDLGPSFETFATGLKRRSEEGA